MVEEIVRKYKKQTTVQLLAKVAKLSGEELDACLMVLEQRGQDTSKLITVKNPRVPEKKDSRVVVEIPADEELTVEEQKLLAAAEKSSGVVTKPKKEVKEPMVVKPEDVVYPVGFERGKVVSFTTSMRSKNPGQLVTGVIKRYFFDKQDQGYYFLINSDGQEFCKKPHAVTLVKA